MNTKNLLLAGCIMALFAVIIGAFGAHALKHLFSEKALKIFHTGVEYQFYHSFAVIIAGLAFHQWPTNKFYQRAGGLFLLGIILFSGSLYLYTLSQTRVFAYLTPLGGLSFIAGWLLMIIAVWKTNA